MEPPAIRRPHQRPAATPWESVVALAVLAWPELAVMAGAGAGLPDQLGRSGRKPAAAADWLRQPAIQPVVLW